MPTYYVSSVDGSDADTGLTWALAKATIAGALALAILDGDTIYVDSAHSFTSAASTAITWNGPTASAHISIISVDRNGSITTGHNGWLAGAIETTGSAAAFSIGSIGAQKLFIYGMTIRTDTGASNSNDIFLATATGGYVELYFKSCTLSVRGTGTSSNHSWGVAHSATTAINYLRLESCSIVLPDSSNAAQGITVASIWLEWIGTTVAFHGANKPPQLFRNGNSGAAVWRSTTLEIFDSDLSGFNAGTLFNVAGFEDGEILVRNCKIASGVATTTGTWPVFGGGAITVINADTGDTENVFEYRTRLGTLLESTSIYADDGADFNAAGISWQVVTTADCTERQPFVLPWCHRYSSSTASTAVGFRIAHDSATDLTDRNLWPEIEYVSNASFPLGTLNSGRNAQFFEGSAADWPNGSDAWTGISGFGNQNKQTIERTFTPAAGSTLRGRLVVGATSKTLYVDPLLRVT